MFAICIIQDIETSQFELTQYLESDKLFRDNNVQLVTLGVSSSIFFFFFTNNLIYWLYGFKYWVISIEVPDQYSREQKGCKCTERTYKLINWVGIALNLLICIAIAWQRYDLSVSLVNGTFTQQKLNFQLNLQLGADFFLAISAGFLADALRRLRNEFS